MTEAFFDAPRPEAESPGLRTDVAGAAFELKFQLPAAEARDVELWARQHLTPDPHGHDGTYRITSVYCDTPRLDVFYRTPGFRRRKFRLRHYATVPLVFLERKTRRKDRVKKKRTEVQADELALLASPAVPPTWAGAWFWRRVQDTGLRPTCRVAYDRTAFFGRANDAPVRLTIDRNLVGAPAGEWAAPILDDGHPLLPGAALVELKFHVHLPPLFQELLGRLTVPPARGSKYRRCVQLCGLAADGDPRPVVDDAPGELRQTGT